MDLASALLKRLDDDGAVTGLVGTRKHWVTRSQSGGLPAIVMQVISEERPQSLDGFDDMRTARVQVAALALRYGEARKVLEAAIAALVPEAEVTGADGTALFWEASVEGPRDTSEDVTGVGLVHRTIADLIIRYSLT
ncbi:hypothetical protein GGQ97_002308 [Sphingomonas kaistensis]|uniref:DUF3168 domain-containing protein n=1 Tax=Sphingomonas kaistensis TaxID=298708 RepID=A0A7X6BHG4_9SPHN|nr:DUF3168 domain-containing protein [Sphingomonas kaistensis]NJC06515.1 hypothetical protein [Sphingomonas kaistensis]